MRLYIYTFDLGVSLALKHCCMDLSWVGTDDVMYEGLVNLVA